MFQLFHTARLLIEETNRFLDTIDQGMLIFKEGVSNYLRADFSKFEQNLQTSLNLEETADIMRRTIQIQLYEHSLLPEYRSDILKLLDKLDDVIDCSTENLMQLNVETPKIPEIIHSDINMLVEISAKAAENLVEASRAFFREPLTVKDKLHRVYFYEKEADKVSLYIRTYVFKQIQDIPLAEKAHIRYFVQHLENVSNISEAVADILAILAIRRMV